MKFLVPLDGSALAETALEPALALLRRTAPPRELILSRVIPDALLVADVVAAGLPREIGDEALAYLRSVVIPDEGVQVALRVGLGPVASVFVAQAQAEGIDLIVLATHGRAGIMRFVLGSVAEEVLRQSTVPLLLVRANQPLFAENGEDTSLRILVPLDGTREAEAILSQIPPLISGRAGEIELLQVVGNDAPAHAVSEAHHYLSSIAARLQVQAPRLTITFEVLIGDASTIVRARCQAHPPDLIALTHHQHGGLPHLVTRGGVFAECLAETTRPLLVQRIP